jgi:hypothetical protein
MNLSFLKDYQDISSLTRIKEQSIHLGVRFGVIIRLIINTPQIVKKKIINLTKAKQSQRFLNKKWVATRTNMIKWTFKETWVNKVCRHLYKYDGMNFHGRIGDLLIFFLKLVNNNTERFGIFLKLVHTTDLKVLHLYISIVVSSMNSTAVNKNTANRIVVGHSW